MKHLGKHWNRDTYYLDLTKDYQDKLPVSNWICFAIANEKPDDKLLTSFIRDSIKNDLFEFKGFGIFGDYLHNSFDTEMVKMEIEEKHPEIEIMTTGSNDTDLSNAFWENYGATCLPDRADYDNIKVICVCFDGIDYSEKLSGLIKRFNRKWLPNDEERIKTLKNNDMEIKLTKSEALVLFDFLTRFNDKDDKESIEDSAEERILWDIESMLEKELKEPFQNDYKEQLEKARTEVKDDIE
jgi:hypothetical protein